ncbi:MAG: DUF1549 domain-containing protein [Planctomycetota bacterium]|nr:DUF1549 domain-containing protein [Planctomycetota bacterium]
MRIRLILSLAICMTLVGASWQTATADDAIAAINQRFASADVQETPNFQKHVVPLFGRLGCNGRACHGSFQGRGGFRLSLFGYDFQADHDAIFNEDSPRVDRENPLASLILAKPIDEDVHEGGKRYEKDSWQFHVIRRWIEGGAEFKKEQVQKLTELKIVPNEILLSKTGEEVQVKAIAIWEDGSQEDVTPLCRFQSNDDQVAEIDQNGLVTATNRGDTHLVISYDKAVVPVPVIRPVTDLVGDKYPQVAARTKVDELVIEKLRKLGVVPSEVCGDAEFLRRVRLDLTGTLPTAEEVKAFLTDEDSNKRGKKVDQLLETPAYAAWWTTKLCDFTGNNTQNLNNVSSVGREHPPTQDWYDWIYRRVEQNVTYDKIVEGIVASNNMPPGQSYTEYCKMMSDVYREDDKSYADLPAMEYYWSRRDFNNNMEARAIGFAYSFMGLRIQCAQCHKHPFDVWSKDDFHQFKNFFARIQPAARNAPREYRDEYNKLVKELGIEGKRNNELQRELPALLKEGKTIPFGAITTSNRLLRTNNPDEEYPKFDDGKLLGGDVVDVMKVDDPRKVVMDWLRGADNPFFAKAFVNRTWAAYFNAGIVNPPDDLNLANPPSNKALLDHLSKGFIESGFDMKWVHRTIANSDTYQRSWQPNDTNKLDERNFSRAVPRRLPAEVAYDAIQQATASNAKAKSLCDSIDGRAIAIAGASARNGGNNGPAFALAVFGKSTRESNCDCDRSSEPSLLQTVFLQNDRDVLGLVDANRGTWLDGVARDLKPQPTTDDAATGRKSASLESQLKAAETQLQRFKKANNEQQVAKAERRISQLEKQLNESNASIAKVTTQPHESADEKVTSYIVDAYLRTLSRYPQQSELTRSVAYVQEANDPVEGLGDILWALINTKEFIVNH